MTTYRERPRTVEAVQYRAGETLDSALLRPEDDGCLRYTEKGTLLVKYSDHGITVEAFPGDYIVRENGFYDGGWKPVFRVSRKADFEQHWEIAR